MRKRQSKRWSLAREYEKFERNRRRINAGETFAGHQTTGRKRPGATDGKQI